MAGMSMKEVARIVDFIEPQGVIVTRTTKGLLLRLPDGKTQMLHFTTSDHRSRANFRAALKRSGVVMPGEKHMTAENLPKYLTATGRPTKKVIERGVAAIEKLGNPDTLTVKKFLDAGGTTNASDYSTASRILYHLGWAPVQNGKTATITKWLRPIDEEPEPIDPSAPVLTIVPDVPDVPDAAEVETQEQPAAEVEVAPAKEVARNTHVPAADGDVFWNVDIDMLSDDMTIWQLRTLYEASGLNLELRISPKHALGR